MEPIWRRDGDRGPRAADAAEWRGARTRHRRHGGAPGRRPSISGSTIPAVRPRGRRSRGTPRPTSSSSAAASPGSGRRSWPRARPGREVVLLEGDRIASGASGRNGGFVGASLTHGIANGAARFPAEIDGSNSSAGRTSPRSARRPPPRDRRGLGGDRRARRRDALARAARARERPSAAPPRPRRHRARRGRDAGRDRVAEVPRRRLEPRRLRAREPGAARVGARGRRRALGVRFHERPGDRARRATEAASASGPPPGRVRARRCVLATDAFPPLLRAIRRLVVPVYDYVLVTEPLSPEQRDAIGWRRRQGLADSGNQFHYYRLTADDRILWGGYDAVYRFGNDIGPHHDQHARPRGAPRNFLASLPAARGHPLHAPLGRRDRHVQPLLRHLRNRPSAGASPTRSASPGSASVRAASGRGSRSTSSTGATRS